MFFKPLAAALTSLALIITLLSPVATSASLADGGTNLIPNPGMELATQSKTQPDSWSTTNSWGNNTASFSYLPSGRSGSHSVRTTVTSYNDGDAKWSFTPVAVTSGSQYSYSDWYESSTATNLWVQYQMSDGTFQYQWLGSPAASSAWAQSSASLTVPGGVVAASIFHVLNANGQLTMDDVSLAPITPCNVSNANGVYNGGFEQSCASNPGMPADWQTETYLNPGATFTYTGTSHSGDFAVQTTLQNGTGEAGWQTTTAVTGGQRYGLTFWHNGTAYVYAYIAFTMSDGSLQYLSLMSVPATQNTGWSQFSDNFIAPAGAQSAQITIATSEAGSFSLDDVYLNSLKNYTPVNFNQGVVSLTFDDGDASTYTNGLPQLLSDNFKGTFYLNGSTIGTTGYMTKSNVKTLAADNEEIASHSYQHIDIVSLTQAQLKQQISQNNAALQSIVGTSYRVLDFASPYGSYTSTAIDTLMQTYQSHRTTDGRFNTKANLSARQIHAILVTSTTTTAQVKTWVAQAKSQGEWLVLVYHAIGSSPIGGDGDGYSTTPAHFKTEMTDLKASGVQVLPVNAALTSLLAQQK